MPVQNLLTPLIEQTKSQIESVETLSHFSTDFISKCLIKFTNRMERVLLSHIDANQAQIVGSTINLDTYINDLIDFVE